MRFNLRFTVGSPMLCLLAFIGGIATHAYVVERNSVAVAFGKAYLRCVEAMKPYLDKTVAEPGK